MNIRAKIFGGGKPPQEPVVQAKKPKGVKADELLTIPVARESRHHKNSRTEDRHRLTSERARVSHKGAGHEVELINLSGGGAMVSGPFEPMLWDRVDLHLGEEGTVECAVLWLRDGRIGLEFAHETQLHCPPAEVAKILRDVIARSFPDIVLSGSDEAAPEVQGNHASDENRAAPRHPLIWNGMLHHDYQSTTVRVRNISATGAMIESSTAVRVGAEPLLELSDSVSMSAKVEWAVGDQVGLSFPEPFDLGRLAEARPSLAESTWSPPAYLGKVGKESPWDPRWNRLTLTELQQELSGYLKY
jgi:PilZ domain